MIFSKSCRKVTRDNFLQISISQMSIWSHLDTRYSRVIIDNELDQERRIRKISKDIKNFQLLGFFSILLDCRLNFVTWPISRISYTRVTAERGVLYFVRVRYLLDRNNALVARLFNQPAIYRFSKPSGRNHDTPNKLVLFSWTILLILRSVLQCIVSDRERKPGGELTNW